MAAPATRRINRGNGHSYELDGKKVVGVTTVLQATPKPGLRFWFAKQVAEFAADNVEAIQALHPNRHAIVDLLKGAAQRETTAAALKGTQIHAYGDRIANGEDVLWAEIAPEQRGYVEAYIQFLDDYDPEVILSEVPVFNRTHRWAGTPDLVVKCRALGGQGLDMIDLKTGKNVYPEVALQVAAYCRAEFYLDADGHEQPWPHIEQGFVLHLKAHGYDLRPLDIGDAMYRRFRYLQMIHDLEQQLEGAMGEPLSWAT